MDSVQEEASRRPLRADARRTATAILEAAECELATDNTATLEQIAAAAGVSRASIHRHFANRDVLLRALNHWALGRLIQAIEDAHPGTAPPLVALYQATYNVLEAKTAAPFTLAPGTCIDPSDEDSIRGVRETCLLVLRRCQVEGHIAADADLEWVQVTYYALLREALTHSSGRDVPTTAALVVRTLLNGAGPHHTPGL